MRIAIIGNSGGGKSTLSRRLAKQYDLQYHEIDSILWQEGWKLTSEADYNTAHNRIIESDSWVLDGLGRKDSIRQRVSSATHVVLIDLPLWQHFWLAAERQLQWTRGDYVNVPGGYKDMPPLREVCRIISEIDQDWMPEIRSIVSTATKCGSYTKVIKDVDELAEFDITL